MLPFYEDEYITLYNASYERLSELDISCNAVITDPPYGLIKDKLEDTGVDIARCVELLNSKLLKNSFFGFFMTFNSKHWVSWHLEAQKYFTRKDELIWDKRSNSNPFALYKKIHENFYFYTKGKRAFNKVYIKNKLNYTLDSGDLGVLKENLLSLVKFLSLLDNPEQKEWVKNYLDIYHENNPKKLYQYVLDGNESILGKGDNSRFFDKSRTQIYKHSPKTHFHSSLQGVSSPSIYRKLAETKSSETTLKHPTIKPLELMSYLIELTTNKGDVVLDAFAGSGSTLKACKKLKRKAIGFEIDPFYCEQFATEMKNNEAEKQCGDLRDFFS